MKAKQKMLLQLTYTQISSSTDQVAELFHRRLQRQDPALRQAFADLDLKAHGRRLVNLIGQLVRHLDQPQEAAEEARELGRIYAEKGLEEVHFDAMGEALLWVLEEQLGELGRDERRAWAVTYGALTGWMKEGAAHAAARRSLAAG